VKLRLTGTRAECDAFVTALQATAPAGVVLEVSGWCPNRGASLLGRVYLELAPPTTAAGTPSSPSPRGIR
jgi:hypothetical protein